MIRKAQEQRHSQVLELKGGRGALSMSHFLEESEAYGTGRQFSVTTIPPGCSIGYHTHTGDFEIYYILGGEATVNDNGAQDVLLPGDSIICREGESHGVENNGDCDLTFISVIIYTKRPE